MKTIPELSRGQRMHGAIDRFLDEHSPDERILGSYVDKGVEVMLMALEGTNTLTEPIQRPMDYQERIERAEFEQSCKESARARLRETVEKGATMPTWHEWSYAVIPAVSVMPLFSTGKPSWSAERKLSTYVDLRMERKGRGGLRYTGPQLFQAHKTVFLGLAQLFRGRSLKGDGNSVRFKPHTFLKAIGWGQNTRNVDTLSVVLGDLRRGDLTLWTRYEEEREGVQLSLVAECNAQDDGEWYVELSRTALWLFKQSMTYLNIARRQRLSDGFQTFLFDYVRTTGCALPFMYDQLQEASGSKASSGKHFRDSCRDTLQKMKDLHLIKDYASHPGGFRVLA